MDSRAGRFFKAKVPAHLRQFVDICLSCNAIDGHAECLSSGSGCPFAANVLISAHS
jgi:hypothetical protein